MSATPRRRALLDARDRLDRAVHGLARQPRRRRRAAVDPRGPRRARSRRSSGPSTPTPCRSPSCCSPARRSATASAAGGCSSIGLALFTRRQRGGRARADASTRSSPPARCRASARRSSLPLTLTLLVRGRPAPTGAALALGIWSGISGLGVALGPLVGGAVVEGISWHWIFWLNVPIGLVLVPLAAGRLTESYGPAAHARPARPRARRRRPARHRLRHRPRPGARLDERADPRRASARASRCSPRSSPGSCARRGADAADALLPLRAFRATNGVSFAMFFGVVRLDLPAVAVLPDRPGPVAAGGRPARRCRGPRCRCSSRRSPACSATGSARGR